MQNDKIKEQHKNEKKKEKYLGEEKNKVNGKG